MNWREKGKNIQNGHINTVFFYDMCNKYYIIFDV